MWFFSRVFIVFGHVLLPECQVLLQSRSIREISTLFLSWQSSSNSQDVPENPINQSIESSSQNDTGEEKPVCEREEVKCKVSVKTSSPSSRKKFTDTDPATGLVRNVRAVMSQKTNKANILTGRPLRDMTGHTGYLTFATLYAQSASADEKLGEETTE